jgi:outer membrane receptor protein involved in Fe transport
MVVHTTTVFGNLSYFQDNWSVMLRWRHLPSVYSANWAQQQALIKNNAAVAAGANGMILGYTPSTEMETDSYNIFDLSFNWNVNETFTVRGGVTNLFDEEPPYVASTAGNEPANGREALAQCNGAPGCSDPTGFSLMRLGNFSGGYYDTIGRRFFLGVKATF